MNQFQPQKANLSKESSEFFKTLWAQNKLLVISTGILVGAFFIPNISILVALAILPFFVWGFLKLDSVNNSFKRNNKIIRFGVLPVAFYLGFLITYTAFAGIYSNAVSPTSTENKQEVAGISDEDRSRIAELEQKAQEEEQKRIEAEKNKQELEGKIAEAQVINTSYDVGSDLGSQDPQTAVQANLAIASLGRETKDQKLFDVTEIIDGDTIKVSELGTLRLIGMDTPETKDPQKPVQCFGAEASNRATELLSGKKVYLEFDPANRIDKYGRTLAYVYRDDGYFFNAEMIKDGFANSYTKFPHPRLEEFNSYQKVAREGLKGLWAPTTCNGDSSKAVTQPTPKTSTPAPIPVTKQPSSQPTKNTTPEPTPAPSSTGFIPGTCKELNARGLGNFPKGSPNYTPSRDRDKDGIACNLP